MKKIKAEQIDDDINLAMLAQEYSDEDKARALLESIRWPKGVICPHCKFNEAYKIIAKKDSKVKARKGMYCCAACRKQFTVTVGTIMEDSHIPIVKWLMAIFIICSSKKSISANQLHRMLKVTYKTAWFLNHRIRHGVSPDFPLAQKLGGIVEVDETFVGGKGDFRTRHVRKVPVVALIEQGGNMRTRVISSVSSHTLGKALNECVNKSATICTDENPSYPNATIGFKAHHSVNHSKKEYTVKKAGGFSASTNHCESFFSLLKRGVYGSWHHVSREHLPKYANEFAFRWNTRFETDGKRMETAIALSEGKRLTYRQAV